MGWFAEYSKGNVKETIWLFKGVELLALLVPLIIAILATISISLPTNYDWYFYLGIGLGIWFILLMLMITPVSMWKQLHEKYEKQQIDLVVESNDQYIQKRGKNWIFRVGIKACGGKSVDNVEITLAKRGGGKHAYSDAPLRPAYSLPGGSSSFTVKPGEIKFVEVLSWAKDDPEMKIHYHCNYQIILGWFDERLETGLPSQIQPFILYNGIPVEEEMTLCATGDNIQSVSKPFKLDVTDGEPSWKEIK